MPLLLPYNAGNLFSNGAAMHRIVIVGGGAGGLELATRLGRKRARRGKAQIELIDANPTPRWNPLLHEVAPGALDPGIAELTFLAHGRRRGFHFQRGRTRHPDREQKEVVLAAI